MSAEDALAAWGGGTLRLIKDRENAVYEAQLTDGRRAALRLHRQGYQSVDAIRSELWWMQAVTGVSVPSPMPTLAGDMLHILPGGRVATMISWVDGDELGAADVALGGSTALKADRFCAIGRLAAQLHEASDGLNLPDWFTRPAWDRDGFLGETPFWGQFWKNPALTSGEIETVLAARDTAGMLLQDYAEDGGDYGLIHADLLRENVLFGADGPVLIDFDDCGFGFRIYDIATLASQNESEPDYAELMAAALAGYREIRALSDQTEQLLPMFVMLRRFASCGWVVPRVSAGDPRMRTYAQRAVTAAERFLDL